MAESGSVAGLVAKWRQAAEHVLKTTDTKSETRHSAYAWQVMADELEAALAKDELRVAAVELAKQVQSDHNRIASTSFAACTSSGCKLAREVFRLAGEA